MSDHGILFSAPMVHALLARRKRVTRRMSERWMRVKKGDRLWVRETFRNHMPFGCDPMPELIEYRANEWDHPAIPGVIPAWTPSIHMPRWASRITLIATEDARLERLQDITEEEARLEGVEPVALTSDRTKEINFRRPFMELWATLHTKPSERWGDNPELVRLAFDYA